MNNKRILGIFLIAVGAVLILNSQTSILGAVIGLNQISSSIGLIIGLALILIGVVLFFLTLRPGRIIRERSFDRSIKKLKPDQITDVDNAIGKIGTGKGKEEKLRHLPGYSIHVSDIGRIRYDRDSEGNVHLNRYEPKHEYD